MVTDAAVENISNSQVQTMPDVTKFVTTEHLMTCFDLQQAYVQQIHIMKEIYVNNLYDDGLISCAKLFNNHYTHMEGHGKFNKKPSAFILYDLQVQNLFFSNHQQPPVWWEEAFRDCLDEVQYGYKAGL